MARRADAVVVGAGIVGVAAAYHLVRHHGLRSVLLADPQPPLSGTSARSTECYRNFFDTRPLVAFMNRAIDGIEAHAAASDNVFQLTRRGYAFASASGPAAFRTAAADAAAWGAGALRTHTASDDRYRLPPTPTAWTPASAAATATGGHGDDTGFDLLDGSELVRRHFPFLTPSATAVLHARRCGWLSAHLYGSYLLEQFRQAGGTVVAARAVDVELAGDRVVGVRLRQAAGGTDDVRVSTGAVINATGPALQVTQRVLDPADRERQALHVHNELHAKISFRVPERLRAPPASSDVRSLGAYLGAVAPMTIWSDPLSLPWTDAERADLAEAADAPTATPHQRQLFRQLLGPLPGGLHFRPYGHDALLALWEFVHLDVPVPDPPTWDLDTVWEPTYAEIVQRGLGCLVPALAEAVGEPRVTVDGGYYCHAHDDHFLIGPHGPTGLYVCGGLRGVGVMGAEVRSHMR